MNNKADATDKALLEVSDLQVSYKSKNFLGQIRYMIRAVNDVGFEIGKGETFGLVGESGSGKTTVGKAILRLIEIDGGSICFDGLEAPPSIERVPLEYRRHVQAVFQDPYSSLNPSHLAGDIIGEPITRHLKIRGKERQSLVVDLLRKVGLSGIHAHRYPYELSGGQRQRIAIARALASNPRLIVCDEPVSALDVSTQAQVINLLEDLQEELVVSYLFIAHDLAVVRHISHNIGVVNLGWLVEIGPSDRVYEQPAHPYTEMLLASIPVPNPAEQRRRRSLRQQLYIDADLPSPVKPPPGCPFQTRCTMAMNICREEMPVPTPVNGGGLVRCHLHTTGPKLEGRSVLQLHRKERKGDE